MAISVARKTIIYEWRRFLAAGVALTLCGLLMLIQMGVLFGMFEGVTVLLRKSTADLVAVSPDAMGLDMSSGVHPRYEARFRMNPDVDVVMPIRQGFGDLRINGMKTPVTLVTVNPEPGDISIPRDFGDKAVAALRVPGTIVASADDLSRLGLKPGAEANLNRKRVVIGPSLSAFRSQIMTYMFGSSETMRFLGVETNSGNPNYSIKLKSGADVERVRAELMDFPDADGLYEVLPPAELADKAESYWLMSSGIGMTFGFTAVFAALIGIGITTQTLRAAVLGSIREYAALRALGFGKASLRRIVLGKAFWIGAASFVVTVILTLACWAGAHLIKIVLAFPWWLFVGLGAFQMAVALLSGLVAMGVLYKSDPAELLR